MLRPGGRAEQLVSARFGGAFAARRLRRLRNLDAALPAQHVPALRIQ